MVNRVLAWIRHGEYAQPAGVPSAHLPHGLTERGREQARAAALDIWAHVARNDLALDGMIDCSPLRRAWETAALLARELATLAGVSIEVREVDALAERSLGAAANLSVEEIERILAEDPRYAAPPPGWKRDPTYQLPLIGAESLARAGQRVAAYVLSRLEAPAEAERARALKLFVGHGGAFRHAACHLGLLSPAQVHQLTMRHATPIYFEYFPGASDGDRFVQAAGAWWPRAAATPLD